MFAQAGPILDLPAWAQTSLVVAALATIIGLLLTRRLVPGSTMDATVTAVTTERDREREAMQRERDLFSLAVAAAEATAVTWQEAAAEQAKAREAAERAAQNAMASAEVVKALVAAFQIAGGREPT